MIVLLRQEGYILCSMRQTSSALARSQCWCLRSWIMIKRVVPTRTKSYACMLHVAYR